MHTFPWQLLWGEERHLLGALWSLGRKEIGCLEVMTFSTHVVFQRSQTHTQNLTVGMIAEVSQAATVLFAELGWVHFGASSEAR